LNCVRTKIRLRPELRQLEMGMSINRNLPPIGTAGLERSLVNGYKREPTPPPRIRPSILIFRSCLPAFT